MTRAKSRGSKGSPLKAINLKQWGNTTVSVKKGSIFVVDSDDIVVLIGTPRAGGEYTVHMRYGTSSPVAVDGTYTMEELLTAATDAGITTAFVTTQDVKATKSGVLNLGSVISKRNALKSRKATAASDEGAKDIADAIENVRKRRASTLSSEDEPDPKRPNTGDGSEEQGGEDGDASVPTKRPAEDEREDTSKRARESVDTEAPEVVDATALPMTEEETKSDTPPAAVGEGMSTVPKDAPGKDPANVSNLPGVLEEGIPETAADNTDELQPIQTQDMKRLRKIEDQIDEVTLRLTKAATSDEIAVLTKIFEVLEQQQLRIKKMINEETSKTQEKYDVPEPVVEGQRAEDALREAEDQRASKGVVSALAQEAAQKGSPEDRLSAGQATSVQTVDIVTGASTNADVAHAVDADTATANKPSAQAENDVQDEDNAPVTQRDRNNNNGPHGDVVMGADMSGGEAVPVEAHGVHGNTAASANAMEVVSRGVPMTDLPKKDAQQKPAQMDVDARQDGTPSAPPARGGSAEMDIAAGKLGEGTAEDTMAKAPSFNEARKMLKQVADQDRAPYLAQLEALREEPGISDSEFKKRESAINKSIKAIDKRQKEAMTKIMQEEKRFNDRMGGFVGEMGSQLEGIAAEATKAEATAKEQQATRAKDRAAAFQTAQINLQRILRGELDVKRSAEFGKMSAVAQRAIRLALPNVDLGGQTKEESDALLDAHIDKAVRAHLLEANKRIDATTGGVTTAGDQIAGLVKGIGGELRARGTVGRSAIFTMRQAFSDIQSIQVEHQIDTMSEAEHIALLEELKPWWNEFRLTRTNQAVMEMEAMPSRIIVSPTGDIQLASKVRPDMTGTEQNYMYFMFWALRTKISDMSNHVSWQRFFKYSAAMGYNRLTPAQINWLITGSPDGESGEGFQVPDFISDEAAIHEKARLSSITFQRQVNLEVAKAALVDNMEPKTPPPNKSTSPSAAPGRRPVRYRIVDGKLRAIVDISASLEESGKRELSGIPSSVSNIPDPRFSERGGEQVENVRIVTRRNPKYKPDEPPGPSNREHLHTVGEPDDPDEGGDSNDPFIQEKVPDIGAGAKQVQADIIKAEADRLLASVPFRLYAPIHPQACDRYLGEKNYARLGMEPEKYFEHYSEHDFGPEDQQAQYDWNLFIIRVYGPMFYAFVTDAAMQRSVPVFDMSTPDGVTLEYMELNELIHELKAYQMKSADRANRVGDSAVTQTPIEKHLNDFFQERDRAQQEEISDANAVVISLPDNPPLGPDDDDTPDTPELPDPDVPIPSLTGAPGVSQNLGQGSKPPSSSWTKTDAAPTPLTVPAVDIDKGIRRMGASQQTYMYNRVSSVKRQANQMEDSADLNRRSKMYRLMYRR